MNSGIVTPCETKPRKYTLGNSDCMVIDNVAEWEDWFV